MIHYHGTPITPREKLIGELPGRCFCVSYADPRDLEVVHEIGQSVMLDNGAFSLWTQGKATDWPGYYQWCEPWLDYPTTWAVIPDVIEGSIEENDALIEDWPHGDRGAPVWHLDEPVGRLLDLCSNWPRVCFGSAGDYRPGTPRWHDRITEAMDAVCGNGSVPLWLHMLRAMRETAGGPYPFASADSTNLARNHAGSHANRPRSLRVLAEQVDARQAPARWSVRERTMELL